MLKIRMLLNATQTVVTLWREKRFKDDITSKLYNLLSHILCDMILLSGIM